LPAPHSAEIFAKAFRALTLMGFRETETKRALARVSESSTASLEQLMRLTLRELVAGSEGPNGSGGGAVVDKVK